MKKNGNLLIKLAACAGFVLALYGIISQQLRSNQLQNELEDLKQQVEEASDHNDELAYQVSIVDSEEYLLYVAREKLGYHQYGETVFINDRKD